MDESEKWLSMAEEDLLWAKASLREEIWRGACFAAQQASSASDVVEKAEEIIEFIKSKLS